MSDGLRLLGERLGVPVDSGGFGAQLAIGQRLCAQLMTTVMSVEDRRSLAAMLATLETLPPIRLEATLAETSGQEPFDPQIAVSSQAGLVLTTHVDFFENGVARSSSENFLGLGGRLPRLPSLGRGSWRLVVHRDGVSAAGFVRLEKAFDVRVTAAPQPPPPPPPPRPALVPPAITATAEPSAAGVMIRVKGIGFLPNRPKNASGIVIRLVDSVLFQDAGGFFAASDGSGAVDAAVGPVNVGTLRRNALGQASVAVSATDSREDPSSVPAHQPLWSNTVTLPF